MKRMLIAAFGAMSYAAILLVLLLAPTASADDFLWLEREWISDADAMMTANPELSKGNDETRSKCNGVYGEMRWEFSGGFLELKRPGGATYSVPYSIHQLDAEPFEILLDAKEVQDAFVISRTERRFFEGHQLEYKAPRELPYAECFAPYGA